MTESNSSSTSSTGSQSRSVTSCALCKAEIKDWDMVVAVCEGVYRTPPMEQVTVKDDPWVYHEKCYDALTTIEEVDNEVHEGAKPAAS